MPPLVIDASDLGRLIEAVNRENFRMNFQPMFSNTPETTLDEAQRISPFVSTVHAQNYVSIGKNRRSLISDGLVDFNKVVRMFHMELFLLQMVI